MNVKAMLASLALLPAGALVGLAGSETAPDSAQAASASAAPEADHPDPKFRVVRLEGTDVLTEIKADRSVFGERSDRLDRYEGSGLQFAVVPGAVHFLATLSWNEVGSTDVWGPNLVLYREDDLGGFEPTRQNATSGGSPLMIDLGLGDVLGPGVYLLRARAEQDPILADAAIRQSVQYVVEITYQYVEGQSS